MENQSKTVPKKLLTLRRQLIQICLANETIPQEFRDHINLEPVEDKSAVLIDEIGLLRKNVQRFLAIEFEPSQEVSFVNESYESYGKYENYDLFYDRYEVEYENGDDTGYEGAETPDREANLKLKKICCKKGGPFSLKNSIGHSGSEFRTELFLADKEPFQGFSLSKSEEYSTHVTMLLFNDSESVRAKRFQDRNSMLISIGFSKV